MALDNTELRFNDAQLLNHHDCRFGQWYDGAARNRYAHLYEFGRLESEHMRVHRLGAEILRLRDVGDLYTARTLLKDLHVCKDIILSELSQLQVALTQASCAE